MTGNIFWPACWPPNYRHIRVEVRCGRPDAARILREVAQEIAADADVLAVAVSHRVGPLAVGDVAIVVAVATAHRREAFVLCARLVDEAMARPPIWKRQLFDDGTDEWVNCP